MPQFQVQPLVAAIEMPDAMHHRRALCGQAGQHQRGAGPQVRGGHARAVELSDAGHGGRADAGRDAGAHAVQFGHVLKTRGKHAVHDRLRPRANDIKAVHWACRSVGMPG